MIDAKPSDPNFGKIVSFTNVSDKDFTHPYGGVPFTVPAGETRMFPYHLGRHLARHLSRKILIEGDKGATQYDPKDQTMKNGHGTRLWNEQSEAEMVGKILGETFTQEQKREKTDIEKLQEQVAELNKLVSGEGKAPVDASYRDKADVIEEMNKLGLPVNARLSKEKLEEQLAEAKKPKTEESVTNA